MAWEDHGSDEHLFANELGVHTTRTVKRVQTQSTRAGLVRSLQGIPWDRVAGRPAGRPHKVPLVVPELSSFPEAGRLLH